MGDGPTGSADFSRLCRSVCGKALLFRDVQPSSRGSAGFSGLCPSVCGKALLFRRGSKKPRGSAASYLGLHQISR